MQPELSKKWSWCHWRAFPGFTEDCQKQATPSAGRDQLMLPALRTEARQSQHVTEMTRDASDAGLFVPQLLLAHLVVFVDAVTGAFFGDPG